ncbi:MAG: hypothetical protein HY077_10870 [Elusimicrobia bacterium]|nr:hypothetical protein [Elusimicrobiota bacterium]
MHSGMLIALGMMGLCFNGTALAASTSTAVLIDNLHSLERVWMTGKNVTALEEMKRTMIQLGDSGDERAKSVLKNYLKKTTSRRLEGPGGWAQVALAKCDAATFREVVAELSSEKPPRVQEDAFKKLELIGSHKAILVLGSKLNDDSAPVPPQAKAPLPSDEKSLDLVVSFPRSLLAAQALAGIIPERPTDTDPRFYKKTDVVKWRQWWKKNRFRFQ